VQLEVRVERRDVEAANVAGLLPGTDPSRRAAPIVLVAHYDHVGFAEPVDGDSLYNGFMDNAVGAATLLAAAEALRASPPARPVIFLFATAEEEGSRGSAYFVAHPPMPLARAAAVNVDLPAPLAPPKSWIFEGDSALGEAVRRVAIARGWTAERGPAQPNSDHWSFLARGVPAVFVVPGEGWEGVTAAQEQALIERWWRPHQPDDEWSADFPAAGLARVAELVVALARIP
jgi:Zn-dependent M28 family amino/carboxypeptidase